MRRASGACLWVMVAALPAAGCGVEIQQQQDDAVSRDPAPQEEPPDDGCATNVVPLELTFADGVADSQVIAVSYRGVEGWLAVDTGSPLTFVFGDSGGAEYVEHAGEALIGCERYPVASLALEAIGPEPFLGKPIIGIVGMDFFSEVPTELDYPAARVVRYLESPMPPPAGFVELDIEWTGDRILIDTALDAQPLRLIYDAGSPHTIWVGQDGEPGDEEVTLGTADGETTTVYEGTATLLLAGEVREIPVWRAPSFPYLAEELTELSAAGLLGATGLGFRHIAFDLGANRMWIGSIMAP